MNNVEKIRGRIENWFNICLKRAKIVDADYWNAKADAYRNVLLAFDSLPEESASKDLEEVAERYARERSIEPDFPVYNEEYEVELAYEEGAQWQKEHLWKDAQGSDLPEIDREVIVIDKQGKVCFAHRPPESWTGISLNNSEMEEFYPERYDKGEWNIPDVKWWLNLPLPYEGKEAGK